MTLGLTPDMVAAAYEYLRVTPPFNGWEMPHADEVQFVVGTAWRDYGVYSNPTEDDPTHEIMISGRRIGYTATLMAVTAHEMVHLLQWVHGLDTRAQHNAHFHSFSELVCLHHGFDPLEFV